MKPSSALEQHQCFLLRIWPCLLLHLLALFSPISPASFSNSNMRLHTAVACMGLMQLSWAAKKCYYPNGVEATTDTPCHPEAEDSMCCFKGGLYGRACLSNKMCQAPDGKIIRGTCTDRNWNSPECASFCMNVGGGGANLISCSNVTDKDTSFCCEKTETGRCCDDGIGRFEVMPPRPVTLALWDSSEGVYTPLAQVSSSSSTSTTTKPSTPSFEPSPTTATNASGPKETGSGDNGSPGGSTRDGSTGGSGQDPAPSSSSSGGGLPVAAQVGIGVGAASVVIMVSVIAWLLWKLHKTKRALVEPVAPFLDPSQQQPSPYLQEWHKQQQQQQQQYQNATELRSGRDWDQAHHGAATPGSAELAHYGPQVSAELPGVSNRYA